MSDIIEYKCPCCGGAVEFNSSVQKMKCPYCDTEFEVDTLRTYNEELNNNEASEMKWEKETDSQWKDGEQDGMKIYSCKSCGGEIIADENTGATSCPYCGNPVVMTGQFAGELRPDYIIPFKVDKKAAKEALKKHVSGKRLLPKVFKSENHIDEIKGIYVPFWLFDADVDADVKYDGERYRFWSDSDYDYTETSHYLISRKGNISFNNVPVDGSLKMPDDITESIEPFDFSEAVDFNTAYLAGYLADKYDVDSENSVQRANERIKRSTENAFRNTVDHYDSVTIKSSNIKLSNGKAKYVLYPVWILNTTWKNEKYTFAMNGQTGKFVGNMPLDKAVYWRWFSFFTIIIGVIMYVLLYLICS